MMGPTHAIGGVAALAGVALVTGNIEHVPVWAYAVAAGSALIPDADNDRGSMLNRPYLLPLKLMTTPLWMGAAHRGRTHSLFGWGIYGVMVMAWGLLFNYLFGLAGVPVADQLNLNAWTAAALCGYASHLFLDLFNIPGMLLLWPLPVRIYFPPWRAHGFIPGRFQTSTWWEHVLINLPITAFIGWFFFLHASAVAAATASDSVMLRLPGALWQALLSFMHNGAG